MLAPIQTISDSGDLSPELSESDSIEKGTKLGLSRQKSLDPKKNASMHNKEDEI